MQTEKFMELFSGLNRAYGHYEIREQRDDGKKQGRAATIRKEVTPELWEKHLRGEESLGIIPINDSSECKFGAIDVDQYDGLDMKAIHEKIHRFKLPLFPCESKSGGVHLYLFTREWVPAGLMQRKLKDMAAVLGFGGSEIFPKQTMILAERGDIGQWINMPYFGKTRWWNRCDHDEFVNTVMPNRVSKSELEKFEIEHSNNGLFIDGPPCLEQLAIQGFPTGTRNDGLFNVAIYLKRKNPDGWEKEIEEYNARIMDPPLDSTEVQGVIKSAKRKDFSYTCNKPPIAPYCNSGVCKLRKHGIDVGGNLPAIHSLTKIDTNPPTWFLDVDGGGRLELETDDLQNQRRFQRKCMDRLNLMPSKMTDIAWTKMINALFERLTIIDMPQDSSPIGQLHEHIKTFCTGNVQAKSKEEMLLGKPWKDPMARIHYFRVGDLMTYLNRIGFREYRVYQVTAYLRSIKADHKFFNLNGKGTNTWGLPEIEVSEKKIETPETGGTDEAPF